MTLPPIFYRPTNKRGTLQKWKIVIAMTAVLLIAISSSFPIRSASGMQIDSENVQRQVPNRCFIDFENGLVYELPNMQQQAWVNKPAESAAGSTVFCILSKAGLPELSAVIDAEGARSCADERDLFEREDAVNQLVPGRPRLNSIRERELGDVEMLSIDLTIDEHTRSITHKLYFKDKTVSVSFFCFTTEVFKQNERLIESMGESITLFDPKREWTKRDSNRVATTFRDEWLGIEIRMLFPFTPSEKGKTTVLNAFSRFDELDCTLLIKQEFADKNQQYMDEFMQHANPKDLLMQNHISEENELTWCMRNSVQQDDDSRFVGRVFLGGFVDRASYGYSHLSLTENELKHYEDVGLLWDMLGGSFPLSKYLPTTERSK